MRLRVPLEGTSVIQVRLARSAGAWDTHATTPYTILAEGAVAEEARKAGRELAGLHSEGLGLARLPFRAG